MVTHTIAAVVAGVACLVTGGGSAAWSFGTVGLTYCITRF